MEVPPLTARSECRESYPWWVVIVANLVTMGVYGLGAYIVFEAGWIFMLVYLAFVLAFEIRLLAGHCVDCCYYGRVCAFGRGGLSAFFFKKGDPARFLEKEPSWPDMIPDLLVGLAPIGFGIYVLVRDFSWVVLVAMAGVLILSTAGNAAVRGRLACNRCRQRELGCPAERLFQKPEA